jgi:hypothetical protein
MSEAVLHGFFSSQDEEQKKLQQSSMSGASAEERAPKITIPGRYKCEVATFAYRENVTNKLKIFPTIFISEKKGSLNLTISLKTVEPTQKIAMGSTIYANIVLCPNSKDKEAIDKTMRFTKPRLAALTGTDNISVTEEWFEEWLIPKYEERGKELVLVKDHKMKQQVMVMVDEELGQDGKVRTVVKSISKVVPGDVSESFEVSKDANSNVKVPPLPGGDEKSDIAFESAVQTDMGAEAHNAVDIPETEPF